ncbi:organic solute transporter Ostalpha-domain-containing protein [Aspergillus cavernicola]|uniref:Organic solute transporter Ostalpha-domain-containing protein n=1 Tax=Aspergillus cavernicola TaxID=176166 RepID=A0ABR4HYG2_9EURO
MGWPVCNTTEEDETIHEIDLWDGGITFHHFCLIVIGAFALVASFISFYLIMRHATHYSKPVEQRHIIRILWMIPIYALVAWLSTYYYKHAVYYDVLGDCYEAFTISAFFALLCHYIAPDLHSQKEYFRGIQPKNWVWPINWLQKCSGGKKGIWRVPRSGLTWFNVVWVGVFQYCLLRVLMTIVAVATQRFDVYCEQSLNPAFAHIWVLAIECVAVTIAMYCLIQFYIQIKDEISEHSPFLKILSIKLVIFLSFWQTSVISFLFSSGAIKSSDKLAAPDLKVTLANLIISIEMALFAVLHLWSFPWKPYTLGFQTTDEVTDMYGNGKRIYHGGRWGMGALVDSLNPIDLIRAVGRSMRWLFVGRKKRTMDPSYQPSNETIGLNQTDTAAHTADTRYEGAGALMTGGASGRYGRQPDEEGEVLLSNAQANPSTGDTGLAPPPYEEGDGNRFYLTNNRSSNGHLAESDLHASRPISPFEEVHYVPSRSPSDSDGNYHTPGQISSEYSNTSHARFPSADLREQPPIPLPDSYQPPHTRYDFDQGQR